MSLSHDHILSLWSNTNVFDWHANELFNEVHIFTALNVCQSQVSSQNKVS